jgi:hypothetical protein
MLHRRRRSGPANTSTLAIAPSLASVQTPVSAPAPTSPISSQTARRSSPEGYTVPAMSSFSPPSARTHRSASDDTLYFMPVSPVSENARYPAAPMTCHPQKLDLALITSSAVGVRISENARWEVGDQPRFVQEPRRLEPAQSKATRRNAHFLTPSPASRAADETLTLPWARRCRFECTIPAGRNTQQPPADELTRISGRASELVNAYFRKIGGR